MEIKDCLTCVEGESRTGLESRKFPVTYSDNFYKK